MAKVQNINHPLRDRPVEMGFKMAIVVFVAISMIHHTCCAEKPYYDVNDFRFTTEIFERFTKEYNRTYSGREKSQRFEYFVEQLKLINKLNADDHATHDINHFTDMFEKEKLRYRGGRPEVSRWMYRSPLGKCKRKVGPRTKTAPASWDWRDKGAVSLVKEQKDCGSCWAVATTYLVESRYLMKGKNLSLSVQQILDCTPGSDCTGGYPSLALTAIMKKGGIESDKDYSYEETKRKCRFQKRKVAAGVKTCTSYTLKEEETLKELLFKEGPLIIGVASGTWGTYKSGILKKTCDDHIVEHIAQLVGYGTEDGVDYWLIKNTWGENWGEQGYLRLQRGINCCSILPLNNNYLLSATV